MGNDPQWASRVIFHTQEVLRIRGETEHRVIRGAAKRDSVATTSPPGLGSASTPHRVNHSHMSQPHSPTYTYIHTHSHGFHSTHL